jgi:voltage-gated potassium channel Kch
MLPVAVACVALLVDTTVLHYEVLRLLSRGLPSLRVPGRAKLIAVILGTFAAHAVEIALYAAAILLLVEGFGLGGLGDAGSQAFSVYLYFSAETFTSLGYGDVIPVGDLRLLAGAEALNGLLLIGWSASYAYIAMERHWDQ